MDTDLQQFEHLYAELGPTLMAYFRQFPGLNQGAEDLVQDTFVRAFRCRDRLNSAVSTRAFVFGIARHVGIDALRRLKPVERIEGEIPAPECSEDPRLESMRLEVAKLPTPMREALMLKLQQDLSYLEIAEVLDVPVGTVRSRLHHAVLRLRTTLNPNSYSL